jgi:hypothetical protein
VLGENLYKVKIENITLNKADYSGIARLNYTEAIAPASSLSKVSVYPNPAADMVNIKINATGTGNNNYNVRISNSSGLVIRDFTTSLATVQQDVTSLIPGTYLVKVINLTENTVQGESKFVKLN